MPPKEIIANTLCVAISIRESSPVSDTSYLVSYSFFSKVPFYLHNFTFQGSEPSSTVLQVSQQSGLWYQKCVINLTTTSSWLTFPSQNRALLTFELETIFAQAPLAPNSIAHPRIRDAYARATGKISATASFSKAQPENEKKRIPGPEDDCPICYEGMHGADKNKLT